MMRTFLVSSFLLVTGCAALVQSFGEVNFLAPAEEAELSKHFAAEVEKEMPRHRDAAVERYVDGLGQRLVSRIDAPEFRYTFRVIDAEEINAFNIGGGYVYVHSGLLASSRTEGEVVSVVAHEIGHQVRRHVAKQISRQQLFSTLAQVAISANASSWVQLAAGLGVTTGQLHFGREAEREADAVMVALMTEAGWDPREALSMFELLRSMDAREPGKVAAVFSSHPPTSERIENVRGHISRLDLRDGLVRNSAGFERIQSRLGRPSNR